MSKVSRNWWLETAITPFPSDWRFMHCCIHPPIKDTMVPMGTGTGTTNADRVSHNTRTFFLGRRRILSLCCFQSPTFYSYFTKVHGICFKSVFIRSSQYLFVQRHSLDNAKEQQMEWVLTPAALLKLLLKHFCNYLIDPSFMYISSKRFQTI